MSCKHNYSFKVGDKVMPNESVRHFLREYGIDPDAEEVRKLTSQVFTVSGVDETLCPNCPEKELMLWLGDSGQFLFDTQAKHATNVAGAALESDWQVPDASPWTPDSGDIG